MLNTAAYVLQAPVPVAGSFIDVTWKDGSRRTSPLVLLFCVFVLHILSVSALLLRLLPLFQFVSLPRWRGRRCALSRGRHEAA